MKFSTGAVLAFASLALSTPVPDAEGGLVKRATNAFATGTKINIEGSTTYFAGSNSYWISFLNSPVDVDATMKNIQASGLKVLRVWGFNDVSQATSGDWFQSFISGQQPQINTGANGLQKLDTVVAAAEKYNIKLIIPFVNYWADYGGMEKYTQFYGVAKKDFYTNANCQTQYRKYISTLVNRYKASTSIFAWELGNEPRCPGCATSVITNWATSVSAYIKSLDPAHMVAIGDEGFMNGGGDGSYPYTIAEGIDFAQNIKIPSIDFATFHLYTDAWGLSAQPGGNNWFKNHAAICVAANKPCVAEEYGIKVNKQAVLPTWQVDSLASPGIAGDMFWQWGEQLPVSGTTHDDGYTIYYGQSDWQKLVRDHVSRINGGTPVTTSASRLPTITATSSVRTSTTSARVSTTAVVTTSAGGGGGPTVPKWGQCGGLNWTGGTTCAAGSTCTKSNDWYWQCL